MSADLSLAAVATSVLTEGIKFLYGQATELLKRRREGRQKAASGGPLAVEPVGAYPRPEGVFEGTPQLNAIDEGVLNRIEEGLGELLELPVLVRVATLGKDADPADGEMLQAAQALRSLLEQVYDQRITFRGESGRPPSGPMVAGEARAEIVEGVLAGVRARRIAGSVHGAAQAREVARGGRVAGVEADVIE